MRKPQITTAIRTHSEVAEIMGISRCRVQAIEATALEKIRKQLSGGSDLSRGDGESASELFREFAVTLEIGTCEPELGILGN